MDGQILFQTLLQTKSANVQIQFNGSDDETNSSQRRSEINIVTSKGVNEVGSSLLKINNIAVYHIKEEVVVAIVSLWNLFVHKVRALVTCPGEGAEGGDGGGDHDAQADLVYLSNRTYNR